ncbi:hypothetical protein KFE96_16710 [Kordiimonas sp. SCSIO 12603]|uniref:DUF748 domain-containing protein n=1 Tax=Kordiimonas sp. SCSIO 12603 TaxID=2829596 RepID=UPI002103688A|nr:hypothetical protein [Kordiimonas sp. SCSIO 12603]UTW58439.1 hypothetical protein KFE96_16710 [Kordiimonas sp. SCSIO 12603]
MKKFILIVLLLILAGGAYAYTQLGTIVKTGFEVGGPEVLNVSVNVDEIQISPLSGEVQASALALGQPKGFGDGPIAKVGNFEMKLEPETLLTNHIIIDEIVINEPLFDIRMLDGKMNIKALQEGLNIPETGPTTTETASSEEITLTIRSMKVTSPKVLAQSDGLLSIDEDINLADFTITDLGTDEKGLAPAEIARHVMDTLQPQIAKALVAAGASKKLQNLADDARGKLEKGVGGLLNKLKKKKDN